VPGGGSVFVNLDGAAKVSFIRAARSTPALGGLEAKMAEHPVREKVSHRWYARPVLFVADVNRALDFYINVLGFEKAWHEGDGSGRSVRSIVQPANSSCARRAVGPIGAACLCR
jgi:hypothetical protein